MSPLLLLGWAIAGWCGTGPIRWPPKGPGPNPDPWWFKIVGLVVGVGVGWGAYRLGVPAGQSTTLTDVVTTSVLAAGGAYFVTDIVRLAGSRGQVQVNR